MLVDKIQQGINRKNLMRLKSCPSRIDKSSWLNVLTNDKVLMTCQKEKKWIHEKKKKLSFNERVNVCQKVCQMEKVIGVIESK